MVSSLCYPAVLVKLIALPANPIGFFPKSRQKDLHVLKSSFSMAFPGFYLITMEEIYRSSLKIWNFEAVSRQPFFARFSLI
jgi:hypothetical protein